MNVAIIDDTQINLTLMRALIGLQQDSKPSLGGQPLSPSARRSVRQAQAFLAAHYQEDHCLSEIARQADCSPFHLARAFRQRTGHSLHAYRTALRLRHGLRALGSGPDLSQLALDLGYSSHSHFSAQFKRYFGGSPSAIAAGPNSANWSGPSLRIEVRLTKSSTERPEEKRAERAVGST